MTATFLEEGPEQPDDSTSSVPPDHHHPDDVQSIKGQLDDVLGESSAKYWSLMEAFLTGMMIKCEFDHFVLQLLPADYVWLHNSFVCCLYHSICTSSAGQDEGFGLSNAASSNAASQEPSSEEAKHYYWTLDDEQEQQLEIDDSPPTPTFRTTNFDFNFADKQSIRANLRTHSKYTPFFKGTILLEGENRRKYDRFASECTKGRCVLEGDLPDAHSLALRLSEAQRLFGMNGEVEAEAVELLYRGLEMHLKNVLTPITTITTSSSAHLNDATAHQPETRILTAAQIKQALEVKPSVFGEDSVSLEYYNL